jgi:hypothetical protein
LTPNLPERDRPEWQTRFLATLAEVAPDFNARWDGGMSDKLGWRYSIRGRYKKGFSCCPLTGIAAARGLLFPLVRFHEAGRIIGLTAEQSRIVMYSADEGAYQPEYDPLLRADMIAVLGLETPKYYG